MWLECPYLGRPVELTPERERHIAQGHPKLLPEVRDRIGQVLLDPDHVRQRPWRPAEVLFVKRSEEDDFAVVVTVDDEPVDDQRPPRTWVVTAFRTPDEPLGALLWVKP